MSVSKYSMTLCRRLPSPLFLRQLRKSSSAFTDTLKIDWTVPRKNEGPVHIAGSVGKGYERVRERFLRNFTENLEPEGSSLAVYHKGQLVVDLWGGYANSDLDQLWEENTATVTFSTTKAVAAILVALLVERGQLNYDALVSDYWPEFAQNGKADITVRMLVSQEAGLVELHQSVTREQAKEPAEISRILEAEYPVWTPGSRVGYHVISWGWFIDQLVRRADPRGRGAAQFYREELQEPFDLDWFIGLSPRLPQERIARIRPASFQRWLHNWTLPVMLRFYAAYYLHDRSALVHRVWGKPAWIFNKGISGMTHPDIRELELWAGGGVGTARGLGKLFSLIGEGEILGKETTDVIQRPLHVGLIDAVMNYPVTSGWGFYHTMMPNGRMFFGHPGYGGQNVKLCVEDRLAICYLTNGITTESGSFSRPYKALESAILECFR